MDNLDYEISSRDSILYALLYTGFIVTSQIKYFCDNITSEHYAYNLIMKLCESGYVKRDDRTYKRNNAGYIYRLSKKGLEYARNLFKVDDYIEEYTNHKLEEHDFLHELSAKIRQASEYNDVVLKVITMEANERICRYNYLKQEVESKKEITNKKEYNVKCLEMKTISEIQNSKQLNRYNLEILKNERNAIDQKLKALYSETQKIKIEKVIKNHISKVKSLINEHKGKKVGSYEIHPIKNALLKGLDFHIETDNILRQYFIQKQHFANDFARYISNFIYSRFDSNGNFLINENTKINGISIYVKHGISEYISGKEVFYIINDASFGNYGAEIRFENLVDTDLGGSVKNILIYDDPAIAYKFNEKCENSFEHLFVSKSDILNSKDYNGIFHAFVFGVLYQQNIF